MTEPNLDKILQELGIWFKPYSVTISGQLPTSSEEKPQILDISYTMLKALIANQVKEAYKKGYNDNARNCYCDSPGATEGVLPHKHLMDDGESHDIRPDIITTKREEV